jgi:predicted ABC-class ATPase
MVMRGAWKSAEGTWGDLARELHRIDGRGYPAYKDIRGVWRGDDDQALLIDHVQGDPFAAPSRVRFRMPQELAGFPKDLYSNRSREVALRDFLARAFSITCREYAGRRGSGKSGLIQGAYAGQAILERAAVIIDDDHVEARFTVGLPARGRRISGMQAEQMLLEDVPSIAALALRYTSFSPDQIGKHVDASEDADELRAQLQAKGWVAFVADGSVLPRRSGVDDRPMPHDRALPFSSPPSLRREVVLPHAGRVTGMAIPEGITLVVGGGFHGKSTLLHALQEGVYNHIPGDGRELVVTCETAVKIRAEEGRSVAGVDISPFIDNLPFNRRTTAFTTENASGSTSQATNIMEALEAGAGLLLLDEDTSATNFMIRDHRMQELIAKEREPITPFVDKVRQLYEESGVSTVLVMGGSGDYFDIADHILAFDSYRLEDVTDAARAIAEKYRQERRREGGDRFGAIQARVPVASSLDPSRGRRSVKIRARGTRSIQFGQEEIDLSAVEQLVEDGQADAIGQALYYAREQWMRDDMAIAEIMRALESVMDERGLDILDRLPHSNYVRFRGIEWAAALNRLRSLKTMQH